jgi:hypothetical protein
MKRFRQLIALLRAAAGMKEIRNQRSAGQSRLQLRTQQTHLLFGERSSTSRV